MLKGKDFGKAIGEAIDLKLKNGSVASKAEIARHFGMKPPSLSDWVKKGSVAKDKLPELWRYFSDVVGPAHWDLTPQEWPAGLSESTRHSEAQKVAEKTPVYRVESHPIQEAIHLMEQMPVEWQRQALGAIKIIHNQFCEQHQTKLDQARWQVIPLRSRLAGDMTNVILLADWKARNLHG